MADHSAITWQQKFTGVSWFIIFCFLSWLVLVSSLQVAIVLCVFIFVVVPLIFRYSYTLQRSMMFLNFVRWPRNFNYSAPEKIGLHGVRNLYVTTDENIKLGVWHILPASLVNQTRGGSKDDGWYESQLSGGKPVILYMHGNSGSRGAAHRVELYKVLRKLDYHVIAFDYRSYGDSSAVEPSERGLVADGVFMFKWLQNRTQGAPVFVWGHSLGTSVSSHALAILAGEGKESDGLILESPFNNMRDELRSHPFAHIFKILPWFEQCFVQPLYDNGLKFDTDEHASKILAPIAILHAEDDRIVPFSLGQKLYKTIQKHRRKEAQSVDFWRFDGKLAHGHKHIYRDPSLPEIIRNFVQSSIQTMEKATKM